MATTAFMGIGAIQQAQDQLEYALEAFRSGQFEEAQVGVRAFLVEVYRALRMPGISPEESRALAELAGAGVTCEVMLAAYRQLLQL